MEDVFNMESPDLVPINICCNEDCLVYMFYSRKFIYCPACGKEGGMFIQKLAYNAIDLQKRKS